MTALVIPSWTPPLESSELAGVLARLQQWTPFDGDAVLEDVGVALDDVAPREEEVEACAARLDGHLAKLVDIAVASGAGQEDADAGLLVRRAQDVRKVQVSDSCWSAVAHLRRLAWSVNELLDYLAATGCIREAA
ncbi:DUF6415 family natural product biosynthesis protein [Streptomyces rochei]|uniref:DUF6415 family natural product biosynthesis protein n=1 Tax=Streptomyces rochei TaxID=1928 RepID=UPI003685F87F